MSFVWTDEEASYLQAVLRWQDTSPEEEKRKLAADAERRKRTAGEFRILVVGAKGSGKTSILTRVRDRPRPLCHRARPATREPAGSPPES